MFWFCIVFIVLFDVVVVTDCVVIIISSERPEGWYSLRVIVECQYVLIILLYVQYYVVICDWYYRNTPTRIWTYLWCWWKWWRTNWYRCSYLTIVRLNECCLSLQRSKGYLLGWWGLPPGFTHCKSAVPPEVVRNAPVTILASPAALKLV